MKDAKVLKCDIDHSPMDMVTKIMMHFLSSLLMDETNLISQNVNIQLLFNPNKQTHTIDIRISICVYFGDEDPIDGTLVCSISIVEF